VPDIESGPDPRDMHRAPRKRHKKPTPPTPRGS
jgi:hypothetical protein